MPPRPISIATRHPRLRLDRRAVRRAIHTLDAHARKFRGGPPSGELSLVFLTDAALARLHADFLADPAPTDVITFGGNPALRLAGEICVSADAALRQVNSFVVPALAGGRRAPAKAGTTTTAFSAELTLYLVHGWLHLAGYDDLQPAKKRAMRRAEARALQLLRAARALPVFTFARLAG
ncbi:MAG: rRNA maturation RNase YbeY [Opitutus sp.]|nr:rRNA maturation RNase YbeY [Opitutus sp.]